jgi:hypothetical protein
MSRPACAPAIWPSPSRGNEPPRGGRDGRWLFAPTVTSRGNLLQENLQGQIHVTGNTVIDALDLILQKLDREPEIGEASPAAIRGSTPAAD